MSGDSDLSGHKHSQIPGSICISRDKDLLSMRKVFMSGLDAGSLQVSQASDLCACSLGNKYNKSP